MTEYLRLPMKGENCTPHLNCYLGDDPPKVRERKYMLWFYVAKPFSDPPQRVRL